MATIGGKSIQRIRRGEPIDRMFIGTHFEKTEGKEVWYEGTHMIKGATYASRNVVETNGLKQNLAGCGMLIEGSADLPQNHYADFAFYRSIMNGVRNFAFVTGKGPTQLMRLFRLLYVGAGEWQDNRISILTDDTYESSMDKGAMKLSGWVRSYEMYTVKNVRLVGTKLAFDIVEGALPALKHVDNTIKN